MSQVNCVEFSSSNLDEARKNLSATATASRYHYYHIKNLTDLRTLPQNQDIIHSSLVLQHNTPPVIERVTGDLLGLLNAGGLAILPYPLPGHSTSLTQTSTCFQPRQETRWKCTFYQRPISTRLPKLPAAILFTLTVMADAAAIFTAKSSSSSDLRGMPVRLIIVIRRRQAKGTTSGET